MTRSICRHHMDVSLSLRAVTMTLFIRRQDMEILLSFWLSLKRVLFFQLASMDYISALEQVWSHSATAV
ncbi:hypothetical protein T10_412 [Trichinella papuae]|uniref:Uncharacterized protein n=1 Tax=Trichinella papuae TaxID=268474 RepID=A0A0V1MY06_9BILA|nr:hypothetical protein T10_412 [Trichinella papuae]